MEVLRKAPDPIFDSNLILDFLDFGDDENKKLTECPESPGRGGGFWPRGHGMS